MNIAGSRATAPYTAAFSILNSANKQPELALDLILQSVSGLQTAGQAHSSSVVQSVTSSTPASSDGKGQLINITA